MHQGTAATHGSCRVWSLNLLFLAVSVSRTAISLTTPSSRLTTTPISHFPSANESFRVDQSVAMLRLIQSRPEICTIDASNAFLLYCIVFLLSKAANKWKQLPLAFVFFCVSELWVCVCMWFSFASPRTYYVARRQIEKVKFIHNYTGTVIWTQQRQQLSSFSYSVYLT